jgi:hypothetical protein
MLEAISNRKGRFPIQKHQKLRQYFTNYFNQNKQLNAVHAHWCHLCVCPLIDHGWEPIRKREI